MEKEVLGYRNRRMILHTGQFVEVGGCPNPKGKPGFKKAYILKLGKDKALVRWLHAGREGRFIAQYEYTRLIPSGRRKVRSVSSKNAFKSKRKSSQPKPITAQPGNALSSQKGILFVPPSAI